MFGFFKKLVGGDKKGFSYKKMAKTVREEMQSWAVANPDCEQEKDSMYLTFAVQPRNLANSHGYLRTNHHGKATGKLAKAFLQRDKRRVDCTEISVGDADPCLPALYPELTGIIPHKPLGDAVHADTRPYHPSCKR